MPRHRFAIAAATAALVASAACAGGGNGRDGALRLGGDPGTLCVNGKGVDEFTYGFDSVANTTKAEIKVTKVTLVGAKNAAALGGYLAPIADNTLIGAMPGWPPQGNPSMFDQKKPMPTTVAAGASANLVVHLKATSPADIDAFEVTYTTDGDQRTVRNSTQLQIRDTCF